jgi:hypothetical protein
VGNGIRATPEHSVLLEAHAQALTCLTDAHRECALMVIAWARYEIIDLLKVG